MSGCLRQMGWLMLVLFFLPVRLQALTWSHEAVYDQQPGDPGIRVDSRGNVHISLFDYGGYDLIYVYRSGESWIVEHVDTASTTKCTSLWLDSHDRPHIAYVDGAQGVLKYARKTGDSWAIEPVDTVGSGCSAVSLVLDARDNPHIAYQDYTHRDLLYAWKSGGSWTKEIVDSGGTTGLYPSLALDSLGTPRIAYWDSTLKSLQYAYKSVGVGAWNMDVVDTTVVRGKIDLELDARGNPHIVYWDYTNSQVRYAHQLEGSITWTIDTVESISYTVAVNTALELDPYGDPVIAYGLDGMIYAMPSLSGWSIDTVDVARGYAGAAFDLALDDRGQPHFAYTENLHKVLKYATTAIRLLSPRGGEVWHPGEQRTVRWTGAGLVDILFSSDGSTFQTLASRVGGGSAQITVPGEITEHARIKITARGSTAWDISPGPIAIRPPLPSSMFYTETVDTAGDEGKYASIAVDSRGVPHIAYYNASFTSLAYASLKGSKWVTENPHFSLTSDVGMYASLALDSRDQPHIAYYDNSSQDLLYTYKSGGSWHYETVDFGGDVGSHLSLALDDRDQPHIAYHDATYGSLKYAYKHLGSWVSETVDNSSTTVGMYTSIAVDDGGRVHVSYYDFTNGDLKYAVRSGGSWHIETVDAHGGTYTSISLDVRGEPHISYVDQNLHLRYAHRVLGTWVSEVVDDQGVVGYFSSLQVGRDGVPRIAYYDWTNDDLKYAYKTGNTWHVQTLDSQGIVGNYTSLALDALGNPHIAYYDGSNTDLKYASPALRLRSPLGGETWDVGALATLKWNGPQTVDVYLSTQGGDAWQLLLSGVRGEALGDTWKTSFRVPHLPTRYARLKLVYGGFQPGVGVNETESDSFFTIRASVVLLQLQAEMQDNGNVRLRWKTLPGPERLAGYVVYRLKMDGSEEKVNLSPVQDTVMEDRLRSDVRGYALSAVNGLGREIRVGEVDVVTRPLSMEQTRQEFWVNFYVPDLLPGQKVPVTLRLLDATGREIERVVQGRFAPGYHRVRLNRNRVPVGVYFLHLEGPDGYRKQIRVFLAH